MPMCFILFLHVICGMIIFLIGFMGSGKTHWGKLWAAKANINSIDLDAEIEKAVGKTVAQIFEEDGEDFFRQKETQVLQNVKLSQPAVVACGGGTPCFNNNLAWMNEHGKTIYLKTSVSTILQRVLLEQEKRPLLKKMNTAELQFFIEQKLKEREVFYNGASVCLEENELSKEVILRMIEG
jgi:shikimate kinase